MIPELGHFLLILAVLVSLGISVIPLWGANRQSGALMVLAKPAALTLFALVLGAFLCLIGSFVADDFSVNYVVAHSNHDLPLFYKVAATWGGHEGSMLLWLLMLSGWMGAVSLFSKALPQELVARILSVMGMIAAGLLLFVLATSNPFDRLLPAAMQGNDLNPQLQDPGMIVHPPLLYMGYVGFSVAFAFAIAALMGGQLNATWARWTRPWTLLAWIFLTLGICLGSAWAYYTLGWGGWWFWDPVENASLMPWLMGTALLHSLAVTEKRGSFNVWTVLLAILAFSLSLLGTFLVRSGVLTSVHAFASDPRRGVFILILLAVVVGASLLLFAVRAPKVGLGAPFELVSRESLLLLNNVLFVCAAGSVLLGTLYPLILDSLGLGKISVGPPYFQTVFMPLMLPMLFLMGIGPIAKWKSQPIPELTQRLRWAGVLSVCAGLLSFISSPVPEGASKSHPLAAVAIGMAFWLAITTISGFSAVMRPKSDADVKRAGAWLERFFRVPQAQLGMTVAHLGVAVFVVGVSLVIAYGHEHDVQMRIGDTLHEAGSVLSLKGIQTGEGPNYRYERAVIEVKQNKQVFDLYPERRRYNAGGMPMTHASIQRRWQGDLYVALGEPDGDQWVIRVYTKPFVDWIWAGCILMAFGGLISALDRRYRRHLAVVRG